MTILATTAVTGDPTTKRDDARLDSPHEAYTRMQRRRQKCRDLMEGTEAIRRNAADYLPRLEGESEDAWAARVQLGALYNAFARTVKASVGMIAVHDPVLGDQMPTELVALADDVDDAGTALAVFTSQLAERGIIDGHAGIFVDMPDTGGNRTDVATAQALGLRPYWILVNADDEWLPFFEVIGGKKTLTLLIRRVRKTVRHGEFGLRAAVDWWVYTLTDSGVQFTRYEQDEMRVAPQRAEAFASGPGTMRNMTRIPYARFVPNGEPTDVETIPPLEPLADLNIEHHQTKNGILSLQQQAMIPTPVRIGASRDQTTNEYPPLIFGPKCVIEAPYIQGVNQPVYYLTPDVTVLDPAEKRLKETELAMEVMGSAFLASQSRAQETAAAKKLNAKAQNATLARMARALGDCLANAMAISGEFLNVASDKVTVPTNFEDVALEPAEMVAYVQAVRDAGLPVRILLNAWQEGGRIPADIDLDALADEMDTNMAADEMQRRLESALNAPTPEPTDDSTDGDA
ncbi:DUF4055 domain-containing protein [Gemmatimonas sp.]|uniref:DUF4055 domain-containing protein n=1 Tax=Gemmatimonas sp. TaxID=1962908 RepID=UPI00333FF42B